MTQLEVHHIVYKSKDLEKDIESQKEHGYFVTQPIHTEHSFGGKNGKRAVTLMNPYGQAIGLIEE